jgi:RimJ/RimL family protein N-acetyltransferase
MHSIDTVRTPRLLLTRPAELDLPDLVRLFTDPEVSATLGGVRSHDEIRAMFDRYVAHWAKNGFGLWILRDPDTGAFIGRGGLRIYPTDGRDEVEVGYALMAPYWGQGLATELARESVRIAFEVLRLPDLISFTLPTNRASQRVMQKAGFVYERDGVFADMPHVFYRLTAERWRELQATTGR